LYWRRVLSSTKIFGEVASYRITGDGIEYIERNVINVVPNYEREAVQLQQKSNNFAYYALIVGVISVILSLALYFFDKLPSAHSSPAIDTDPSGKTPKVSFGNVDSSEWFIKTHQSIPNYVPEDIANAPKDDFEREVSYYRIYRHPSDCQSSDIRGVLIQVIFFKSDAGSRAYFTKAFADIKNTNPAITNSVGDTSYFRKYTQDDGYCNGETNDMYSLLFQRYNAIGVIKTWSVPNSVDDNGVREWLNVIATELDTTFKENSK
jgi:hypothetical protein